MPLASSVPSPTGGFFRIDHIGAWKCDRLSPSTVVELMRHRASPDFKVLQSLTSDVADSTIVEYAGELQPILPPYVHLIGAPDWWHTFPWEKLK